MMFNRRMLMGGTAASAIIAPPVAHGKDVAVKNLQRFCINPYRERNDGDATITVLDILSAEFVRFGNSDGDKRNWFQIITHDGRTIQTECFGRADKVRSLTIMNDLRNLGVSIKVRNFA